MLFTNCLSPTHHVSFCICFVWLSMLHVVIDDSCVNAVCRRWSQCVVFLWLHDFVLHMLLSAGDGHNVLYSYDYMTLCYPCCCLQEMVTMCCIPMTMWLCATRAAVCRRWSQCVVFLWLCDFVLHMLLSAGDGHNVLYSYDYMTLCYTCCCLQEMVTMCCIPMTMWLCATRAAVCRRWSQCVVFLWLCDFMLHVLLSAGDGHNVLYSYDYVTLCYTCCCLQEMVTMCCIPMTMWLYATRATVCSRWSQCVVFLWLWLYPTRATVCRRWSQCVVFLWLHDFVLHMLLSTGDGHNVLYSYDYVTLCYMCYCLQEMVTMCCVPMTMWLCATHATVCSRWSQCVVFLWLCDFVLHMLLSAGDGHNVLYSNDCDFVLHMLLSTGDGHNVLYSYDYMTLCYMCYCLQEMVTMCCVPMTTWLCATHATVCRRWSQCVVFLWLCDFVLHMLLSAADGHNVLCSYDYVTLCYTCYCLQEMVTMCCIPMTVTLCYMCCCLQEMVTMCCIPMTPWRCATHAAVYRRWSQCVVFLWLCDFVLHVLLSAGDGHNVLCSYDYVTLCYTCYCLQEMVTMCCIPMTLWLCATCATVCRRWSQCVVFLWLCDFVLHMLLSAADGHNVLYSYDYVTLCYTCYCLQEMVTMCCIPMTLWLCATHATVCSRWSQCVVFLWLCDFVLHMLLSAGDGHNVLYSYDSVTLCYTCYCLQEMVTMCCIPMTLWLCATHATVCSRWSQCVVFLWLCDFVLHVLLSAGDGHNVLYSYDYVTLCYTCYCLQEMVTMCCIPMTLWLCATHATVCRRWSQCVVFLWLCDFVLHVILSAGDGHNVLYSYDSVTLCYTCYCLQQMVTMCCVPMTTWLCATRATVCRSWSQCVVFQWLWLCATRAAVCRRWSQCVVFLWLRDFVLHMLLSAGDGHNVLYSYDYVTLCYTCYCLQEMVTMCCIPMTMWLCATCATVCRRWSQCVVFLWLCDFATVCRRWSQCVVFLWFCDFVLHMLLSAADGHNVLCSYDYVTLCYTCYCLQEMVTMCCIPMTVCCIPMTEMWLCYCLQEMVTMWSMSTMCCIPMTMWLCYCLQEMVTMCCIPMTMLYSCDYVTLLLSAGDGHNVLYSYDYVTLLLSAGDGHNVLYSYDYVTLLLSAGDGHNVLYSYDYVTLLLSAGDGHNVLYSYDWLCDFATVCRRWSQCVVFLWLCDFATVCRRWSQCVVFLWLCCIPMTMWLCYCLQEMAELKLQLEKVHLDERKKEEVELKAAQQRKAAIEDLEKGVCCLYCFMPVLDRSVVYLKVVRLRVVCLRVVYLKVVYLRVVYLKVVCLRVVCLKVVCLKVVYLKACYEEGVCCLCCYISVLPCYILMTLIRERDTFLVWFCVCLTVRHTLMSIYITRNTKCHHIDWRCHFTLTPRPHTNLAAVQQKWLLHTLRSGSGVLLGLFQLDEVLTERKQQLKEIQQQQLDTLKTEHQRTMRRVQEEYTDQVGAQSEDTQVEDRNSTPISYLHDLSSTGDVQCWCDCLS